ncbi:hypothetical protein EC991_003566 [Linnemannia zychae]|nr:hypothetical protein EC991_003566 [Linnemannia zychae]
MVSLSGRPLSGTSPHYLHSGSSTTSASAGGTFRMFGSRRKMNKFRFRIMVLIYLAMGCIIPYYVMRQAEEEQFYQQVAMRRQRQEQLREDQLHEEYMRHGGGFRDRIRLLRHGNSEVRKMYGEPEKETTRVGATAEAEEAAATTNEKSNRVYKRKAFFQDLSAEPESLQTHLSVQESMTGLLRIHPSTSSSQSSSNNNASPEVRHHLRQQHQRQRQALQSLAEVYDKQREQAKFNRINSIKSYENRVIRAVEAAKTWIAKKMLPEHQAFETRIPGTNLNSIEKTKRFRQLMSEALDSGRWVYEPERDYPDFGGATGWNKKKHGERDRDVAIDRAPFPEAGKYHWEPNPRSTAEKTDGGAGSVGGWHATRIQPEEFCRILGPRHIVLVGDLIHWQLHDSIMYNMFDNPQACYGDLACHLGVGHPLCPLPNDVRLKFVRNDLLSTVRSRKSQLNETKTQDPVEMPWLKDMRLKDTVILGATHQTLKDKVFQRLLTDTINKIRKARPDALIIYRNNPVGHPECPSKANGFNANKAQQEQRQKERQQEQQQQQQRVLESKIKVPFPHTHSTFGAPARPFTNDIPIAEILNYPLNWAHYDRQNQIAKTIVEASGGIYWNVATMTNMRPDGHVGGQDCLSYKRPGPTDEWAVSLFNLFKTIEAVERE